MNSPSQTSVIVVGAGPTGLLLSLLLSRSNIAVLLLEKENAVETQPRATHYAAPAMSVLQRVRVVEAMSTRGFYPRSLCWRTVDNVRLTGMDHSGNEGDPDRMICLPVSQLSKILLLALEEEPMAKVLWNHEVTGISKLEDGTGKVEASTPEGKRDFIAKYVVGCDGANSALRRLLFGDQDFPGKTWDYEIVATNVSPLFDDSE
jgi:2-polyprenyl-6-methoxyphenol hydroxylase-like FAD-dependent oxidoreductase